LRHANACNQARNVRGREIAEGISVAAANLAEVTLVVEIAGADQGRAIW
jgi:hypothetical protein